MQPAGHLVYRFEGIEVDPARGCLRRNGEEIHLPQKPLQVLVYLLEQHERLVTKEELMGTAWKNIAVTDDALVQCVVDIRKALGDDPRNPRFIKTVARVGYRFVGPVEVRRSEALMTTGTEEITSVKLEYEEETPDALLAANGTRAHLPALPAPSLFSRRPALITALALLLLVALGVTISLRRGFFSPGRPRADTTLPAVPGKKSVAVMYFENGSGNSELNWLRGGLADMIITDLSRSARLTVLSRQQLQAIRERGRYAQPGSAPLQEALDIARKSRAELLVLGSFAKVGEKMRIDAQVYDARTSQVTKAESLIVDRPEQILVQVDLLSLKLAADLGAGPAAEESKTTLAAVMTKNLEAYRYYSLGMEKVQGLRPAEAIALFEKAVALDPQFAMAYARIGYVHTVVWGHTEAGKPYLEKAFQLSNRLTEKDRLSIAAWYAIANQDYPTAIKSFRELISRFPMEVEAYWRLGRLLEGEGQVSEAVAVLEQALVIDPEEPETYNRLAGFYSDLGRHNEAIAMGQRYVAVSPQDPNAHDSLGMAYQWAGLYDQAIQEYGKALALDPKFEIAVAHLGNTHFQMGQYHDAIRLYQRFLELAPSRPDRARGFDDLAWVYWRKGELDQAAELAKKAGRQSKSMVLVSLLVAAERGDFAAAKEYNQQLIARTPYADRGFREAPRRITFARGYIALKSGHAAEAIEFFTQTLRLPPSVWKIDSYEACLADGYLALGRVDEAIAEYERILRLNPNYPLAHYHLGQAYDRKGRADRAQAEYQQFLQIWKDADSDIPQLIAAKTRLAQ